MQDLHQNVGSVLFTTLDLVQYVKTVRREDTTKTIVGLPPNRLIDPRSDHNKSVITKHVIIVEALITS